MSQLRPGWTVTLPNQPLRDVNASQTVPKPLLARRGRTILEVATGNTTTLQQPNNQLVHASYQFQFHTPPDIEDSSIENVIVAGTFNNWRRTDYLRRNGPGSWSADLEFTYPAGCRYFLYKYYIQHKWNENDIPEEDGKWLIDYHNEVLLHPEGKNCNYLSATDTNSIEKQYQKLSRKYGEFTFFWPKQDGVQVVEAIIKKLGDPHEFTSVKLAPTVSGDWELRNFKIEYSTNDPLQEVRYYSYRVDGIEKYNPNQRMGKDSAGKDLNVLLQNDIMISKIGQLEDNNEKFWPTTERELPIHELDIKLLGPANGVSLVTSVDGWKTRHKFATKTKIFETYHQLRLRVAAPLGTKILFSCLTADGVWEESLSRPFAMHNGRLVNYHILGTPFNTVGDPEEPTPFEEAPEIGSYTFEWLGSPSREIWVARPFNNWTKQDRFKLKRSPSSASSAFTLTVNLPIQRARYKFIYTHEDYTSWAINPLARAEIDSKADGITSWVNYILPEDYKPAILDPVDGDDEIKGKDSLKPCSKCRSEFKLSPRAAEARGM